MNEVRLSTKALPIYVVSAPSGTGKTTLNRRLVAEYPEVEISISLTTRRPRPGEQHGVDYYFIDKAEFQSRIRMGEMLENALVHGNFYGTSLIELGKIMQRGHMPLLEIDVQGWQQAHTKLPHAVSVFIIPPSMRDLWKRLEGRGTDSLETRLKRMRNARTEIASAGSYDYFIVNDDLEKAYRELCHIIISGQPGTIDSKVGMARCAQLVQEYDGAEWLKSLYNQSSKETDGSSP